MFQVATRKAIGGSWSRSLIVGRVLEPGLEVTGAWAGVGGVGGVREGVGGAGGSLFLPPRRQWRRGGEKGSPTMVAATLEKASRSKCEGWRTEGSYRLMVMWGRCRR